MELKELVGEHILDAVDFSNEQVKTWGDSFKACQVVRFRLDGKVYIATEDPDDGYRSSMEDLTVGDWQMTNIFPALRVIGRYRTKGSYSGTDDVLELVDVGTGNTVLEVGTENVDDYYPGFVASFHPEAMTPNAKVNGPLGGSA